MHAPPLVGITTDVAEAPASTARPRALCALAYADAVHRAGGLPILLPAVPGLAPAHASLCHAVVLTGGDDPRTEPFGEPTHPAASPLHPRRQEYELALLEALRASPEKPVLAICLGMQLLALTSGGRLNQHLPDTHPSAPMHRAGAHAIEPDAPGRADLPELRGVADSHHHQAVADPGRLRVLARAPDAVIEAVDDPSCPFRVGVQWHPERTAGDALGDALFRALVAAARTTSAPVSPSRRG